MSRGGREFIIARIQVDMKSGKLGSVLVVQITPDFGEPIARVWYVWAVGCMVLTACSSVDLRCRPNRENGIHLTLPKSCLIHSRSIRISIPSILDYFIAFVRTNQK